MIVLVGASGFFGSYILREILNNTNETVIATYSSNSDFVFNSNRVDWVRYNVLDPPDCLFDRLRAEEADVVYLAAYHNPDKVMENEALAWDINVTSLARFVNRCSGVKSFYYSSTDSVYGEGGEKVPLKEEAALHPVNRYGELKLLAERIVLAKGFNILRFPFMFGPSLVRHKKHFFDKILESLRKGEKVEMFEDSIRSSISFAEAARLSVSLLSKFHGKHHKVLNISSDDAISKYQFALKLAKNFHLDGRLVCPVSQADHPEIFKANRSLITILDNSELKRTLNLSNIPMGL